ncbi:ras-related protein Rab-3-like isoform X1 [Watersipora subatra]|uniref:ras-related protein Rab-3-like isoform X1 n=1 Tax=Watersipora subatra TaxID=2589382 RepID=UPI00355B8F9E
MFSNVPGGNLLNNIGGNISNLGDKVNPSGALGNIGSKFPGNLNNLNPTNIAGNFTGTSAATGEAPVPPARSNFGGASPSMDMSSSGGQADGKWQKDAADQNFDYMFKLLIIGNSSVGKTSFLFRYADDSFTSAFVSTVGIDFKVKTVFRNEKRVKLQIWDTAGQERYRTITTAYYRGAMGFILMYDVTNEESFNAVQDWLTNIQTHAWPSTSVVLCGNKCDMDDQRVVPEDTGSKLAEKLGLQFFETSAKDNINVKAVFERLVDIICDKMAESLDSDPNMIPNQQKGARLTDQQGQAKQGGCC